MDISLVPSLHHLTCCQLVSSIFNHLEVQENFRLKNYETIQIQVKDAISRLTSCIRLQVKLEKFIDPLVREIEDWLKVFEHSWYGYDTVLRAVLKSVPHCWKSDGTINKEKSARILVKNEELRPINRFVFACTYCFYDDVLDLWNTLFKIEKAYLRHKSTTIVKLWIEWLENTSVKDQESFLVWTFGNSLWYSNAFILKKALQILSPAKKSQCLLNAFMKTDISNDVMYLCVSTMKKAELEEIFRFRESSDKLFKCMLSWPLQAMFFDLAESLWSYLTEQSFGSILYMILKSISSQERVDMELLNIVKNFWALSPCNFQKAAKDDSDLFRPLKFVLDFDMVNEFPKREFSKTFLAVLPYTVPMAFNLGVRRRRGAFRRRNRNIQ